MGDNPSNAPEWFATPDPRTGETGLRFSCTLCGSCCTGPEGYVLVSDAEIDALAGRMGLSREAFIERFTHMTVKGRSLIEQRTNEGMDCVFLDRRTISGKAVCGVYEDRPMQCRTWPFWPSIVRTRETWDRTSRHCPGMGKGTRHGVIQIRVLRDAFEI